MATFLNILLVGLKAVEVAAVSGIVLIGADLAWHYNDGYKREDRAIKAEDMERARLRQKKELEAYEGFFEESYVRGFDSTGAIISRPVRVPTQKAYEYYRMMEQLADEVIIDTTEGF